MEASELGPSFGVGGAGTYRCAPTGIKEEVGGMSCRGWLVGNGSVAQGHAHNGRHVSFCAKDVDGDSSSLPCKKSKRPMNHNLEKRPSPQDMARLPESLGQCWVL